MGLVIHYLFFPLQNTYFKFVSQSETDERPNQPHSHLFSLHVLSIKSTLRTNRRTVYCVDICWSSL
jgi:hypothetical protein